MRNLKSALMGAGGVVLAAFILTILAPRADHAVAAALVQVAKTSAS